MFCNGVTDTSEKNDTFLEDWSNTTFIYDYYILLFVIATTDYLLHHMLNLSKTTGPLWHFLIKTC